MALASFKAHVAARLAGPLGISADEVERLVEYPPDAGMGDLAVPCFTLAKQLRKAPAAIAQGACAALTPDDVVAEWSAAGPYVNVRLDRAALGRAVLTAVLSDPSRFGALASTGKRMVLDYSSPNIAKAFHIGHLRSTIIGNALRLIFTHLGWEVVGVNHLGDWGTQFGKLIVAFTRWGDQAKLQGEDPIAYLEELYVRFHKELEADPTLDDRAREAFKRLEDGAEEERRLWQIFRDMSLAKFKEIYALLGVAFDHYSGESFYADRLDATVARLTEAGLTSVSDGATVVNLDAYDMPVCLLRKSDGASLYATRDLAAAMYRMETWNPDMVLYVHGAPQRLHFAQFFKVMELLDPRCEGRFQFAGFGQYRFNDRKLSTREGNVIHLEDVIAEGLRRVHEVLEAASKEGRELEDPDQVAHDVAIGGLLFGDLSSDRMKDINFDWDRMLDFEGDTGPYVQYTHARCRSLLRKAQTPPPDPAAVDPSVLTDPEEVGLLIALGRFPEAVALAAAQLRPHHVAQHLLLVARAFNKYYHSHPGILRQDEPLRSARVALVAAVAETVALGLRLLGIPSPEAM